MAAKARTQANRRYNEKSYDRVYLQIPKGEKERYMNIALSRGMSLSAFIYKAMQSAADEK